YRVWCGLRLARCTARIFTLCASGVLVRRVLGYSTRTSLLLVSCRRRRQLRCKSLSLLTDCARLVFRVKQLKDSHRSFSQAWLVMRVARVVSAISERTRRANGAGAVPMFLRISP